jgi:hypothetical protein
VDQNIEIARTFSPFPEGDMDRLRKTLQPSRQQLEKNLSGHYDGPTIRPHQFWA